MRIILASNNAHKLEEIKAVLAPMGFEVLSMKESGAELEVEETGTTFEENSLIKARALYELCGLPVIADDSGLEVDALDNAPGVYSHRYAGENATDAERCEKLLKEMQNEQNRSARFVCVISYIDKNGFAYSVRGECSGTIGYEPMGENGFGYDPIFMYGEKSFAQLSAAEKNSVSHRADALKKFAELLSGFTQD